MPIDASIYGNLRPVEMPSILDTAGKAANLSALAMQQQRMGKQMEAEDKENAYKQHAQKLSVLGNALESVVTAPEEQKPAIYAQKVQELEDSGLIPPGKIPKQYDPQIVSGYYSAFKNSDEYMNRQLKQSQIAKNFADANKERLLAGKKDESKTLELTSGLRKEWTGLATTKATQDVAASIERIRQSYENPSPAGDLAMIFNYMKMLDPGSTVREGEFANAQNSAGVPDRIRAQYNKVMSGERLAETQRQDFASQAERQYAAQLNAQSTFDKQYAGLAQRYGVDPSLVMMKFPEPKELKLAIKKEEEKPGFFASLFGKPAQAAGEEKKAPPKHGVGVGGVVEIGGKRYQVGADGDTLTPL